MSDMLVKLSEIKKEVFGRENMEWISSDTELFDCVLTIFNSIDYPKKLIKNIKEKIKPLEEYLITVEDKLIDYKTETKKHDENLKEITAFFGYSYKVGKEIAERKEYDRYNKVVSAIKIPKFDSEVIFRYVDDILNEIEKEYL